MSEKMPEVNAEKDPKEVAQEAVENFFEAYQDKYKEDGEVSEDSEEIIKKYMDMFTEKKYVGLKIFLKGILRKYERMPELIETEAIKNKKEVNTEAIKEYDEVAQKTRIAIEALETLE